MKGRAQFASVSTRIASVIALALALHGCGGGGSGSSATGDPNLALRTQFNGIEDRDITGTIAPGGWSITLVSGPTNGTLTGPDANGAFTYTPAVNFFGGDSFVVDAMQGQQPATRVTVSLTIEAQNDAPSARADTARTAPSQSVVIDVLMNDDDVDDTTLTPQIDLVSNGTAVANTDGTVTFTPAARFAGTATFQYVVRDTANALSSPVTVTIEIQPQQRIVYFTGGSLPQLIVEDPAGQKTIDQPLGENGEFNYLQLSKNGRTVIWLARQSGTYHYSYSDLFESSPQRRSLPIDIQSAPGPVLSPTGTHLLTATNEIVQVDGLTVLSNRAYVRDLLGGQSSPLHDVPVLEQVSSYRFTDNGEHIVYRTNQPARFTTGVEVHRVATSNPDARQTLLGPTTTPNDIGPLHPIPGDSEAVYLRLDAGMARLHRLSYVAAGVGQPIGPEIGPIPPLLDQHSPRITGHAVSADGRKAAMVVTVGFSPNITSTIYLVDVATGVWEQVAPELAASQVSAPAFAPNGSSLFVTANDAAGTAIYQIRTASPTRVTQVSEVFSGSFLVSFLPAANGDFVVYQSRASLNSPDELFVIDTNHPRIAERVNLNNGLPVLAHVLSPDGRTIAYSQREPDNAGNSLFIVDVSTPGLPKRVTNQLLTQHNIVQPFALSD